MTASRILGSETKPRVGSVRAGRMRAGRVRADRVRADRVRAGRKSLIQTVFRDHPK